MAVPLAILDDMTGQTGVQLTPSGIGVTVGSGNDCCMGYAAWNGLAIGLTCVVNQDQLTADYPPPEWDPIERTGMCMRAEIYGRLRWDATVGKIVDDETNLVLDLFHIRHRLTFALGRYCQPPGQGRIRNCDGSFPYWESQAFLDIPIRCPAWDINPVIDTGTLVIPPGPYEETGGGIPTFDVLLRPSLAQAEQQIQADEAGFGPFDGLRVIVLAIYNIDRWRVRRSFNWVAAHGGSRKNQYLAYAGVSLSSKVYMPQLEMVCAWDHLFDGNVVFVPECVDVTRPC